MKKLKLSAPIKIDGTDFTELLYDFDLLTVRDLLAADKLSQAMDTKQGVVSMSLVEFNVTLHLELFLRAVTKAMPNVARMDLDRMSAKDGMVAAGLGRNFFLGQTAAEDGQPDE